MANTITPFLWYNGNAEQAMQLYCSIFPNSSYTVTGRLPDGTMFSGTLMLDGQQFYILNAPSKFTFTEASSLFISCKNQQEIDNYWEKLIADGGTPSQCGWLKDKFGLSWQVIPENLGTLLNHPDPAKAQRTMAAMLQMSKLDIAALENA